MLPWPLASRTMKCELLPAVGGALFSPAVGPLFSPAVGLLFWLLVAGIIQSSITVMFSKSAGFTQVLVDAACLTFFFVSHGLRDVLMAFHELLGGDAPQVLRVVWWNDECHATDPLRIFVHVAVLHW